MDFTSPSRACWSKIPLAGRGKDDFTSNFRLLHTEFSVQIPSMMHVVDARGFNVNVYATAIKVSPSLIKSARFAATPRHGKPAISAISQ